MQNNFPDFLATKSAQSHNRKSPKNANEVKLTNTAKSPRGARNTLIFDETMKKRAKNLKKSPKNPFICRK